jgi:hypothetical protein
MMSSMQPLGRGVLTPASWGHLKDSRAALLMKDVKVTHLANFRTNLP